MTQYKIVELFRVISKLGTNLIRQDCIKGCFTCKALLNRNSARLYTEGSGKKPSKEEEIDAVKMPGFVHPQTMHEEGYFTQKAKQQLEELKKRVDKPTIENTEKKE